MAIDWSSFFASGVEELGAVAKAKDTTVRAEAKAQAEEFNATKEAYEDEITKNKNNLRKETDSLRALGIQDVGKIRTVMSTYGNVDVMEKLEKDFQKYQSANLLRNKTGEFKNLSEYVKGRISGAGTAMLSDEAAEQASDEAAIIGGELDIQKAEEKAKSQGITLTEYLDNQAKKMTDRPAFDVDARAARLVEESKMGLFGKTITFEEAKQKILQGKTMGEEAKDLPDTGFAMTREGGLSPEEEIRLRKLKDEVDPKIDLGTLLTREKAILKGIDGGKYVVATEDGLGTRIIESPESKAAMLKELNRIIAEEFDGPNALDKQSQKIVLSLKEKYEKSSAKKDETKLKKPKPSANAIRYLRNNPDKLNDFIQKYGEDAVPPDMKK